MMLRVATFNIRNGRALDGCHSWPFRRRSTAAAIERLNADVIGLQEAYWFQLRWLLARLPSYSATGSGRSRRLRNEHCPILVLGSAGQVLSCGTYWYGPTPEEPGARMTGATFPRIFTTLVLRTVDEAVVQISNTHLDERHAEHRRLQVEQLLGSLDWTLPQIVVGDLNEPPGGQVAQELERLGMRGVVPEPAIGTNHDFTGTVRGERLDHIFVSADLGVGSARVLAQAPFDRLPSDHWPLLAEIHVPPGPGHESGGQR